MSNLTGKNNSKSNIQQNDTEDTADDINKVDAQDGGDIIEIVAQIKEIFQLFSENVYNNKESVNRFIKLYSNYYNQLLKNLKCN